MRGRGGAGEKGRHGDTGTRGHGEGERGRKIGKGGIREMGGLALSNPSNPSDPSDPAI